jgi:hypothetical protein
MREAYENNIIEKAKKEMKILFEHLKFEVSKYGDKITLDGVEYFNKIEEIVVKYGGYDVVYYNVEKKQMYCPKKIRNLEASKYTIKIVNNYAGREIIKMPKSKMGYTTQEIDELYNHLSEQEMYEQLGIIL